LRREDSVRRIRPGQFGETITDENGTTYCIEGWPPFGESKVYPPEYWGVFPLYFFDAPVGVQVSVENLDPRNVAKVRVRVEAYPLETDGTHGAPLCLPSETDIEVAAGATKFVDASIVPAFSEDSESGLDRMVVKILHPNKGQDDPTAVYDDPALILMKEAIFCPPILSQPVREIVNQMLLP